MRSSLVPSEAIDADVARAHGIRPAPNRAILNVVLPRDRAAGATVHAQVTAVARDLAGIARSIEMRPAPDNGFVSYMGTFEFLPREVLDFEIRVRPEHARSSGTLRYRERMWSGRGPADH